jgi:hypothetical protein
MIPNAAAILAAQLIVVALIRSEPHEAEKQPELAVLAVAVRWAVDSAPQGDGVVYLAVDNHQDPPEALFSQLRGIRNLRRVSECPKAEVGGKLFPKPARGNVVLLLHSFSWHSKKRASGWVVRYSGPESAVGCREYFALHGAHWQHSGRRPDEGLECGLA